MNSSEPAVTKAAEPLAQVRPVFDWIELLAVPLASSIMETQPIALVLLLGATIFTGANATAPLSEGSITLLLLGLQWWAILIQHFVQRGMSPDWAKFFHPLGLCAACLITVGTHLALLNNIPALIISLGLVIWFWRRGMNLARVGQVDEYLITAFKVGFGVLLAVLILTAFYFSSLYPDDPSFAPLHDAIARALTIFFLSGVIGLSFTRISIIRRENAYRTPGNSLADPTRAWLVVLTLLWGAITATALAFEAFSFGSVTTVMLELWNGLGTLVNWFFSVIGPSLTYLFNLIAPFFPRAVIPTQPSRPTPLVPPTPHFQQLPEMILLLIRLALVLMLLAIVLLVIRAILQRWRVVSDDDSEEEERESLSLQSVMKQRREDRERKREKAEAPALEPLDPDSARARYRELLQALAASGAELARRPNETPSEYEKRLLILVDKAAPGAVQQDEVPADAVLLDELTQAYGLERYGGKHTDLPDAAYLPAWIPQFVKRLVGYE